MVCEKCNGNNAIFKGYKPDGLPLYERCICVTRKMWAQKLGMQIFSAPALKKSSGLEKHINTDVFIRGPESKFFPHLKITLIKQGLSFNFKLMNDSKIFNIWIGKDDDYKALQDLVPFELLVIMLGATVYENRAHAAVMLEAIHVRMLEGKPTWIHSPLELDEVLMSKQSAPEYVDQFKGLIDSHFKKVEIGEATTVHQKMKAEGQKLTQGKASQNAAHNILSLNNGKKER